MVAASRKLLIVEDDPGTKSQLQSCFDDYDVIAADDRVAAINELRRHEPPVVLHGLDAPRRDSAVDERLDTLREIVSLSPHTKVVVVTGHDDRNNAVRAMGCGAHDFYHKPLDVDVLRFIVARAFRIHELEAENRQLMGFRENSPLDGIIASSEPMIRVCRMVEKVAPTTATTLLMGESGTGKEVLARAIHGLSPRINQPFVAINCAAIPEALLESELFGFEKGAFTGAVKQTQGKLEVADGGTLFLDEIGDMPLALQAKLLRFLQERTFERIGGRNEIAVDVRVVCATNQNLNEAIQVSRFREDLYYRISEITVDIPPVRERDGCRVLLAQYLLNRYTAQHAGSARSFSSEAQDAIDAYAWPGNVREMENKIKGAVILADGKFITAEDLGLPAAQSVPSLNLRKVRQKAEMRAISEAMARSCGNISRAAKLLGITRPTLYHFIQKYDMPT